MNVLEELTDYEDHIDRDHVERRIDDWVDRFEALYRDVAAQLTDRQMVELLMTIGYYMLVSRLLENVEVDIETESFEPLDVARVPRP